MIPLYDADIRPRRTPYVNYGLIGLCSLVFLVELVLGPAGRDKFFLQYGLIPGELTQGVNVTGVPAGVPAWASVITAMFIHVSILHIAGNMIFLWVFGNSVEDRLGHVWYFLFYFAAGIVASVAQVAVDPTSQVPNIGASGAIAGVLGAYLLMYPFSRIRTLIVFFFISYIVLPAWLLLGVWIILQFFEGVGSLGPSSSGSGVAYFAHLGGFATGIVVIAVLKLVVWREPLWSQSRRPGGGQWWRGRQI